MCSKADKMASLV